MVVLLIESLELEALRSLKFLPEDFVFFEHRSARKSKTRAKPHQEINLLLRQSEFFLRQDLVILLRWKD